LEICFKFFNITGKKVIVPTNTFVATAAAVIYAGGTPIFCEVDQHNSLDIEYLKLLISTNKNVAGVVIVHIAGFITPRIFDIIDLCHEESLFLIEDCAHATGASLTNKMSGTFGDAGCFSFYPTKVITTGSGGMITTELRDLKNYAESLRLHGKGNSLYDVINLGNDWFLDEIRCVIGYYQLRALASFISSRERIAHFYLDSLTELSHIELPLISPEQKPSWYKFILRCPEKSERKTQVLVDALNASGVEAERLYWPICPLQPVFKKMYGYSQKDFPKTYNLVKNHFTIPLYVDMPREEIEYTVSEIKELTIK
jgi:perosamine synthetase